MVQLVAMLFLFILLCASSGTVHCGFKKATAAKGPNRSQLPKNATGDFFRQISTGSGGLQAKLRWSGDLNVYLLELEVGTPARNVELIIDTYDNFIWIDCLQNTLSPGYYPVLLSNSTYRVLPCNNLQWQQILFVDYTYCTQVPPCTYDCGWASGVLANETFGFAGGSRTPPSLNLSFGCNNVFGFNNSGSSGYAGIGRGPLSLISQLSFSKFSYCFPDIDSSLSSYMFFGSYADLGSNEVANTTSFAKETDSYILDLRGISVGDKLLPIPANTLRYVEESSGTIIYTTDPFTYLVPEAYRILKDEITSQIGLPVYNKINSTFGNTLCFNWTSNKPLNLSTMTYHFSGADMTLPISNFLLNDTDEKNTPVVCLMVKKYNDGYSYLGSYQMQNFQFIYDLENYKLSFKSTRCDQLQPHKSHANKFHLHGTTFYTALILLYLLLA